MDNLCTMGYLTSADLKRVIQTNNLNDIVGNDTAMVTYAEQAAITEAVSYLSPKYMTEVEFTDTVVFMPVMNYSYKQRFLMDASPFSNSKSYGQYETVAYNGNVYWAKTPLSAGAFNANDWQLVGKQGNLWYLKAPAGYVDFTMSGFYRLGDKVMWNGVQYTCVKETTQYDHGMLIQFGTRENIPPVNQFPDAIGQQQWSAGVPYYWTGTGILNGKFTEADNRNQQLVNYIIDIMLYHLHARISPRNIPELRLERYDNAINWLKQCAKGDDINAGLPRKTPQQGMRIRWGGKVQNNFDY